MPISSGMLLEGRARFAKAVPAAATATRHGELAALGMLDKGGRRLDMFMSVCGDGGTDTAAICHAAVMTDERSSGRDSDPSDTGSLSLEVRDVPRSNGCRIKMIASRIRLELDERCSIGLYHAISLVKKGNGKGGIIL